MSDAGEALPPLSYHHATKHGFGRFARSLGYLDWANQPSPFRRFEGAPFRPLPHEAVALAAPYASLYTLGGTPFPITEHTLGEFLRCGLGLSAWKQYGTSRWALRVNPSSGNLHPTEGYVLWQGRVHHYAPAEHALEMRAEFGIDLCGDAVLVALTSIHWREAWKYGERAFRYCQHDIGHALGALRLSAARLGWTLRVLPGWSDADVSAVLGLDRAVDFEGAETEAPDLIALVAPGPSGDPLPAPFVAAARQAVWHGRATRLSTEHVEWPAIDAVTSATLYAGAHTEPPVRPSPVNLAQAADGGPRSRDIILGRRSATAFDPQGSLERGAFLAMLRRLRPVAPPWDACWWPPQVHLVLFVHRVEGVTPGIYAYLRDDGANVAEWRSRLRPEFLWEAVTNEASQPEPGLYLLAPLDVRALANRLSCDQSIASDGFFSLAMLARTASVAERGPWFYRHLFWECGLIGQVLYLEAESVRGRSTGIGCFYDEPVHEVLGLDGDDWQSLYHFSMGRPLDDSRLTTEPGYPWEDVENA